ncbi:hypothetical protein Tco_0456645 [Tanacetum coccineum]
MDEFDSKTQGAQENAESPYDTESEIKIINSYQAATISGLLFIHQRSLYDQNDQDVIDITPKDTEEKDALESLSVLRSMPDDDLASMTGFEIQDSTNHVFEKSTMPLIVTNTLKEQLPDLLLDALKDTLPELIKDSIKSSVLESIAEELP